MSSSSRQCAAPQHPTAANEVSSRSHAVLQVVVETRERAEGRNAKIKIGKLSLVDLAGSERAAVTKNRGARLQEGANINRFATLGNCINALCEKGTVVSLCHTATPSSRGC